MAESKKNKWKVTLNSAAMGLEQGDNVREVEAESMSYDPNSNRVVFYVGDEVVTFFQHPVGVEKL